MLVFALGLLEASFALLRVAAVFLVAVLRRADADNLLIRSPTVNGPSDDELSLYGWRFLDVDGFTGDGVSDGVLAARGNN